MAKDTTSLPRTTKRIGSLRFFIKHRGTTKKNFGKASPAQMRKWKAQLREELTLRKKLQAANSPQSAPAPRARRTRSAAKSK